MSTHGTKEYRQEMAAIHEEVVRTGEPTIVTKDGRPYVKIVPAVQEAALQRLHDEGAVVLPSARRVPVEPIDAGGDDTTSIVADIRW
jgi:antitoxin (DNA-binding transcriptional repressor) of toxin-antitoxin stability system